MSDEGDLKRKDKNKKRKDDDDDEGEEGGIFDTISEFVSKILGK